MTSTPDTPPAPSRNLAQALEQQQLSLPPEHMARLEQYCALLWDWNSKLNLTRHTDYDKFVARDVVDSLQLSAVLQSNEEVLDVGSGGGVPGIVLAIVRPDLRMTLSDSIGKKANALTQMLEALELDVAVHPCRAEEVLEAFRFDSLVARAVGPLDKMLAWFDHDWQSIGRLLAIKGPRWTEEVNEAKRVGRLRKLQLNCIAKYPMPGTESESVILEIRPLR